MSDCWFWSHWGGLVVTLRCTLSNIEMWQPGLAFTAPPVGWKPWAATRAGTLDTPRQPPVSAPHLPGSTRAGRSYPGHHSSGRPGHSSPAGWRHGPRAPRPTAAADGNAQLTMGAQPRPAPLPSPGPTAKPSHPLRLCPCHRGIPPGPLQEPPWLLMAHTIKSSGLCGCLGCSSPASLLECETHASAHATSSSSPLPPWPYADP